MYEQPTTGYIRPHPKGMGMGEEGVPTNYFDSPCSLIGVRLGPHIWPPDAGEWSNRGSDWALTSGHQMQGSGLIEGQGLHIWPPDAGEWSD